MADGEMRGAVLTFQDLAAEQVSFADALAAGLSRGRKAIPCQFLYDERGSALFDEICRLPEYYPTRTESAILADRAGEIAELAGEGCQLVELGSGSSAKVRLLLGAFDRPYAYVPIDISREHLRRAARAIAADHPDLVVAAMCADYHQPFDLPSFPGAGRRLGFFPGSTIGNLAPEAAEAFLTLWARRLGQGAHMLIGVDLKKDRSILEPAYDDAAGVTAAFSLNVLDRANREVGADFDLTGFRHQAVWQEDRSRIEIHLKSLADQTVRFGGEAYAFGDGELIHIEDSCKYSLEAFEALARRAGFETLRQWTDEDRLFSVHYLQVA